MTKEFKEQFPELKDEDFKVEIDNEKLRVIWIEMIKKYCLSKQRTKKIIDNFDDDNVFETSSWATDAGCSIAEFRAFRNSLIMSILRKLGLEE